MGCSNCTQKLIEADDKNKKIVEEAQLIADQTGEWVGVWHDNGRPVYSVGAETIGKPVEQYVTPKNLQ